MRTPPSLLFRVLLLLICALCVARMFAQEQDDPLQRLPTLESRKIALADLVQQRAGLEETGAYAQLVPLINRIGELQLRLFDLDAALASANEARETATRFRGTENEKLYIDSLIFSARVHIRRDENDPAFKLLDEAYELSQNLNYRAGEAAVLTHRGIAYLFQNNELSQQNSADALVIWRELNNRRAEADTLITRAEAYMVLDKLTECADALNQAEVISRELNDHVWTANTLINKTFLAIRQGQWQTALGSLNEAETFISDKDAEPYLAGQIAMSYGEVYEAYGQLQTARNYLEESLQYYRDGAHDKSAAIDAGNKLARVMASLQEYGGAKAQLERNLVMAQEVQKGMITGLCYEDLGRVHLREGSYEDAKRAFGSALTYFSPNTRPWARTQTYLGQTEYLLGNLTAASNAYGKALRVFQNAVLDYTNEAALRFGLGKLALRRGNFKRAEQEFKRSIDLTKVLRENASSKDLRSSFLDSVHDRYEAYVEVLMARYFKQPDRQLAIEAFEVSESGRALALLDSLYANHQELRRPSDPALLTQEKALQQQEQQLVDRQTQLVSANASAREFQKVNKDLADLRSRYETLQARMNPSAKFANLLRPKITYEGIKQLLTDSNASLLEYSLGDTNSFAWLVTKDGIETYKLPEKRTIEQSATSLVRLLQKPAVDSTEEKQLQTAINDVSRLLLEPVSDKLHTSRLIVVADGALQYVPFQVLKAFPTASEPLVAQFDIVDAPSASALASVREERVRRNPGSRMVVGFGDPIFSPNSNQANEAASTNASRSDAGGDSKPLPILFNAKRELDAIGNLAGKESAFYEEYEATRANLLNVDLSHFRILHIVTHGVFNDDQPELSGLYLSLVNKDDQPVNGFVGLSDIYRMHAPVDLVVLSACHTALGKTLRGEGLVGLTRGFMYAGASSVVASLWQADDAATAELMKYFYTYLLHDGMTPPAALRAAQNKIRSQPKWRSPYYWAGFTVHGDYDLNLKAPPQIRQKFETLAKAVGLGLLVIAVTYWYLRRRKRSRVI